jgi:hypothetical protein
VQVVEQREHFERTPGAVLQHAALRGEWQHVTQQLRGHVTQARTQIFVAARR